MKKLKRAPGAGRKPKGDFKQVSSPLSIRMTADMRKELEAAANANGRSISQELLRRLQNSFKQDRDKARDPAMRALCFLIAELAGQVAGFTDPKGRPLFDWRSDPFFFRAFKLALGQVLDALEPGGKIRPPRLNLDIEISRRDGEGMKACCGPYVIKAFKASYKTPEARADMAARTLLSNLQTANPSSDWHNQVSPNHRAKVMQETYGMAAARHELRLKLKGAK